MELLSAQVARQDGSGFRGVHRGRPARERGRVHRHARQEDDALGFGASALREVRPPAHAVGVGGRLPPRSPQPRALATARVGLVAVGVVLLSVQLHRPAGLLAARGLHQGRPARRPRWWAVASPISPCSRPPRQSKRRGRGSRRDRRWTEMAIKALTFDVFGTVVDWRSSIFREGEAFGRSRGITGVDWQMFADKWRGMYQPAMDEVRNGRRPFVKLDVLHRESLEKLVADFGIKGLGEADLDHLNRAWHRLDPWPDSVPGLQRMKKKYILATLSNGNVALMVNMARRAGLPWDTILGAEVTRHYKPQPECYLGTADFLGLEPAEVALVAAHNSDLATARRIGFRTCFVTRPNEKGPGQDKDLRALIEHLKLRDVTLVLHDFGGPFGLSYAIDRADNVRSLVLMNTWLWSLQGDPHFERFGKLFGGAFGRFLYLRLNFSVRVIMKRAIADQSRFPRRIQEQYLRPFASRADRVATRAYARALLDAGVWYYGLWRRREKIRDIPTLILWGMQDQAFRAQDLDRLQTMFSHKRTACFHDAGHFPQEERPERVVSLVQQFLAT